MSCLLLVALAHERRNDGDGPAILSLDHRTSVFEQSLANLLRREARELHFELRTVDRCQLEMELTINPNCGMCHVHLLCEWSH